MQKSLSCTIVLKPAFCILVAASLLLFPVQWLASWLIAAAFHELCHFLALILCRARIYRIEVGMTGARIETDPLSTGKEMLCAFAGPLGGLGLCLLSGIFPRLSVCALIQSIYNLLPLLPFDGGRVLSCLFLFVFGKERGRSCMKAIEVIVVVLLILLAFWATFVVQLGLLPLACALTLLLKSGKLKFPCKAGKQIVQ